MTSPKLSSGTPRFWDNLNLNIFQTPPKNVVGISKDEESIDPLSPGSIASRSSQTSVPDELVTCDQLSSSSDNDSAMPTANGSPQLLVLTPETAQTSRIDQQMAAQHDDSFHTRLPTSPPTTPAHSQNPSPHFSTLRPKPPPPIHFTYTKDARHYDEPASDEHESEFWRRSARNPLQALSRLRLYVGFFPQVTVDARRDPPRNQCTKPSVAAILYILIAAGGPLSVASAEKVLFAYDKEYKNQTIRKAFCKGNTFVQTADKKAWTIPKVEGFVPRKKASGDRKAAVQPTRKRDALAAGDVSNDKRQRVMSRRNSAWALARLNATAILPRIPDDNNNTESSSRAGFGNNSSTEETMTANVPKVDFDRTLCPQAPISTSATEIDEDMLSDPRSSPLTTRNTSLQLPTAVWPQTPTRQVDRRMRFSFICIKDVDICI